VQNETKKNRTEKARPWEPEAQSEALELLHASGPGSTGGGRGAQEEAPAEVTAEEGRRGRSRQGYQGFLEEAERPPRGTQLTSYGGTVARWEFALAQQVAK
jgi:hypothetical protein